MSTETELSRMKASGNNECSEELRAKSECWDESPLVRAPGTESSEGTLTVDFNVSVSCTASSPPLVALRPATSETTLSFRNHPGDFHVMSSKPPFRQEFGWRDMPTRVRGGKLIVRTGKPNRSTQDASQGKQELNYIDVPGPGGPHTGGVVGTFLLSLFSTIDRCGGAPHSAGTLHSSRARNVVG